MATETSPEVKAVHIVTPCAKRPDRKEGVALWAINQAGHALLVEPDLVIAMDDLRRDASCNEKYVRSILAEKCPIYTSTPYKNAEAYPLAKVVGWLEEWIDLAAWRLLDNTCNYALALALCEGYKRIILSGFRFVSPYSETLLTFQIDKWRRTEYPTAPDWFKYYGDMASLARTPTEPGSESLHFLLGLAVASGVKIELKDGNEGVLNSDRDKFYYGFQEQPHGL